MNPDSLLLTTQYFPNIQYCSKLLSYSKVYLEGAENYHKSSYRNRCHIASTNGLLRLSIPLKKGKNQQQSIRSVQIAYDLAWQNQHWRSISTAYGNAPFFEHYAEEIRPFFQKKYEFLFDFNWDILQKIMQLIDANSEIEITETYQKETPAELLDYRNTIHPNLKKSSEDLHFQAPKYRQVFEEKFGFLPNLSILDLLFCVGPQSSLILENAFRR